jgi:uncharacterized membrane protein YdjX (TVP38/TMEM64 family)
VLVPRCSLSTIPKSCIEIGGDGDSGDNVRMNRINPIYVLIALNIVLFVFRDVLISDETSAALATSVEAAVIELGIFGYASIVLGSVLCAFFFVPLLIPLNILGGALYGAYDGTIVAIIGVTLGTIASTVSARHVFTGMHQSIDKRPLFRRLLKRADRHPNLTILLVRFAFVVPYLVQNIALSATRISITRIALVTAVSAIPGAAIYSFLGAGLVRAEQVDQMLLYLSVPVVLMLVLSGAMAYFNSRDAGRNDARESNDE